MRSIKNGVDNEEQNDFKVPFVFEIFNLTFIMVKLWDFFLSKIPLD